MSLVPPGFTVKEARRFMQAESAKLGEAFVELDADSARSRTGGSIQRALRNRHFLVQQHVPPANAPHILCRLSISRSVLNDKGDRWLDGITWDQLQAIKAGVGYADHDAIEVYPRQGDVVNVANIRHLWVLREPLDWAWGEGRRDT